MGRRMEWQGGGEGATVSWVEDPNYDDWGQPILASGWTQSPDDGRWRDARGNVFAGKGPIPFASLSAEDLAPAVYGSDRWIDEQMAPVSMTDDGGAYMGGGGMIRGDGYQVVAGKIFLDRANPNIPPAVLKRFPMAQREDYEIKGEGGLFGAIDRIMPHTVGGAFGLFGGLALGGLGLTGVEGALARAGLSAATGGNPLTSLISSGVSSGLGSLGGAGSGALDSLSAQIPGEFGGGNVDLDDFFGGTDYQGDFGYDGDYGTTYQGDYGYGDDGLGGVVGSGLSEAEMNELVRQAQQEMSDGSVGNVGVNANGTTPGLLDWLKKLPTGTASAVSKLLKSSAGKTGIASSLAKLASGDLSGVDDLLKAGLPLAMLAGAFQNSQSPLTGTLQRGAESAIGAADRYAALPALTISPSQQRSVDLTNANVGNYKPYIDEGTALTRSAAKGIPGVNLDDYINPYMKAAIDPAADVVRRDAEKKQIRDDATAGMRGAFGGSSAAVEKAANTRDTQTTVGNLYATGLSGAFDRATGLATTDLNRRSSAGTDMVNTGKAVSTLGNVDATALADAGKIEQLPETSKLDQAKTASQLYSGALPGTTQAAGATKPTNTLGQLTGALGTYAAANKLGLV